MGDRSSSGGVRNIRAMFEAKSELTTSPPSRGRSPAGSDGARSTSSRPISKVRTSFIAVEKSGAFGTILGLRRMSDSTEANGVASVKVDNANDHPSSTPSEKIANGSAESLRTGAPLTKVKEEEGGTTGNDGNVWVGKSHKADTASRSSRSFGSKPTGDFSVSTPASASTPSIGLVLKGSPFEPLPGERGPASSKQSSKKTEAAPPGPRMPSINGETKFAPQKAAPAKLGGSLPPAINTKATSQSGLKSAENSRTAKSNQPSPSSLKTPTSLTASRSPKASPKISTRTASTAKEAGSSKVEPLQKETPKVLPEKQSRRSLVNRKVEPKISTISASSKSGMAREISTSNPALTSTSTSVAATTPNKQKTSSALVNPAKAPKLSRRSSTGFLKPPPKSPTRPVALPASATASTAASAAKTGTAVHSRSPSRASKAERTGLGIKTDRLGATRGPKTANTLRTKSSRISLEPERPRSSASNKIPDEGFLARMMRPTASSASKTHEKLEPKSPPRKLAPQPRKKSDGMSAAKNDAAEDDHATLAPNDEHEASMEPGALEAASPSVRHAGESETGKRHINEETSAQDCEDAGISTLAQPIAT